MQDKTILVTINNIGEPTFEAFGYTGSDCLKATEALEKGLAGELQERLTKPEMHQGGVQQQKNTLRNW